MCSDLVQHRYYTEFIEVYSQTEAVLPGQMEGLLKNFPTWMEEVESGLDKLGKNSAIDSKHVGIMGFSLGAYLSLSVGALDWDKISAIVEYYGGMPPQFDTHAAS